MAATAIPRGDHLVAVVQEAPVMLDRAATLDRAIASIAEAADNGARLVALPETYVPGYPFWVWKLRPDVDSAALAALHVRLLENSIDLAAGGLQPICDAAKKHRVTVVCGIDERDGEFSRASIYNTVVIVGPDGAIRNRHRKLMPTNPERTVWAIGDGSGLRTIQTPAGRVGSLICWENYMPLARFALFAQGVDVYVAPTWDEGDGWAATMRHIALEGRCWVLGASSVLQGKDVPADFPARSLLVADEDAWINEGGSTIVDPGGTVVAGPLVNARGILYADCPPARAGASKRTLDVAGHYGRTDIFSLTVNRDVPAPARFSGGKPDSDAE
jgi:nitrilase